MSAKATYRAYVKFDFIVWRNGVNELTVEPNAKLLAMQKEFVNAVIGIGYEQQRGSYEQTTDYDDAVRIACEWNHWPEPNAKLDKVARKAFRHEFNS